VSGDFISPEQGEEFIARASAVFLDLAPLHATVETQYEGISSLCPPS